jgi:hypothetical protein
MTNTRPSGLRIWYKRTWEKNIGLAGMVMIRHVQGTKTLPKAKTGAKTETGEGRDMVIKTSTVRRQNLWLMEGYGAGQRQEKDSDKNNNYDRS